MKTDDIVLVNWPFTGLTSSKRRPALLLHVNEFDAFLLLFITSQQPHPTNTFYYTINAERQNKLKANSFVRIDKMISLNKSECSGIIGRASAQDFKAS